MRGCVSKRGNSWCYVVEFGRHPETGRRRQKSKSGFESKVEAEKALAKVLHELNTNTYMEPTKDDVATYMASWLAQKKMSIRPGTYKTYRWLVNFHIIPRLGHHKMVSLAPQHLVELYDQLLNGENKLSPQTITHLHKILHDALETAVQWEAITKNVAKPVKPPKVPKAETKVWDEEELGQFLTFTKSSRYHIIFLLAATTGMRRGEILGLKWEDINLEKRKLSVRRSYTQGDKGYIFQEPKTASGIRTIVLSQMTVNALQKQKQMLEDDRMKLEQARIEYKDYGMVAQTKNGFPINPSFLEARWRDLLQKSGLPKIRLHDLRHTHASLLLKAGIHPKAVSERLGHSSILITLDRYTHLFPSLQEDAAQQLDSMLAFVDKN